tara:strand:+ start:2356 stop:2529 length:174 start_codon:yes stop_codon:yes gene_type:complete
MTLLEFIFQSFWHFVGTLFLLAIIVQWKPFSSSSQGLTSKQFNKLIKALKEKENTKD